MSINKIIFLLNNVESILLEFQDPLVELDCCYEGMLIFVQKEDVLILSNDSIRDTMDIFARLLKKALCNELVLDESINNDIGFMYNQYNHYFWVENSLIKEMFVHVPLEKSSEWIGMRYLLWESSWIYNNKDGDIIFEVTPFYPYLHSDPAEEPRYVPYDLWIKDYKPRLIRVIPRAVAQEWLKQASIIKNQIEANIERWQKELRNKKEDIVA